MPNFSVASLPKTRSTFADFPHKVLSNGTNERTVLGGGRLELKKLVRRLHTIYVREYSKRSKEVYRVTLREI